MALATALSSVGIEAEMGGSAISKAMVKMQNAVELGGGKLQAVLDATDFLGAFAAEACLRAVCFVLAIIFILIIF